MKALVELQKEGQFSYIGLSECGAGTLRRAHGVCLFFPPVSFLSSTNARVVRGQVAPVALVEIEISPFAYEQQTKDVIATAKELGIAVAGYSYGTHALIQTHKFTTE